ncbi:DUF2029 domain-containing protein [bacterium]|nr:DUF2029 domain-containing protein [bacterium]
MMHWNHSPDCEREFGPRVRLVQRMAWTALLVAGVAWYITFRVALPLRHEPFSPPLHGNDFKHLYLGASLLVWGENPYDAEAMHGLARMRGMGGVNPYVYLPFTGLVLSPLTSLDPPEAFWIWFGLNHLFLAAALALLFVGLGMKVKLSNVAMVLVVSALCYPIHRTLTAGQLNCLLLLLFSAVFALLRRGFPVLAGILAAVAFLVKLMPGILLVYLLWNGLTLSGFRYQVPGTGFLPYAEKERFLALRLRWRAFELGFRLSSLKALLAMVAATAVLLGACVVLVGWQRHLDFLPVLSNMGYGSSTWAQLGEAFYRHPYNQSANAFFHHILASGEGLRPWVDLGKSWANGLTYLAWAVCVGLVFWKTRPVHLPGAHHSGDRLDRSLVYGLFVLLGLLTPSLYWDHYAVIALWPLWAVYGRLKKGARVGAAGLLVLVSLLLGGALELGAIWRLLSNPMPLITLNMPGFQVYATCLALALVVSAAVLFGTGVARFRGRDGVTAVLWALAGAMILSRFMFDHPAFRQGVGLLAMSLRLWGTLILFGLALVLVRAKEKCDWTRDNRTRWQRFG